MIKNILLHHNFIKLAACVIGYSLWAFIVQYQTLTVNKQIPLCFYQTDAKQQISAPDHVKVMISGKRKDLYHYNPENSALHLDASGYKVGSHQVQLTAENLFLPDSLKLVQLIPSDIALEVTKS